jgi:hypothetical protein
MLALVGLFCLDVGSLLPRCLVSFGLMFGLFRVDEGSLLTLGAVFLIIPFLYFFIFFWRTCPPLTWAQVRERWMVLDGLMTGRFCLDVGSLLH